jgi:hypothetical protein
MQTCQLVVSLLACAHMDFRPGYIGKPSVAKDVQKEQKVEVVHTLDLLQRQRWIEAVNQMALEKLTELSSDGLLR